MSKGGMRAAGVSVLTALYAGAALGQSVTVEYDNGVRRTVDCKEAFYQFRDDPSKTMWFTCDGFEAADIPLSGNKSDPANRDAICSGTDGYDPARPISIRDRNYESVKGDFSDAMLAALAHVSLNHDESVMQAINMRAQTGIDVFTVYRHVIRPPGSGERADGQISTGERFVFQPGWNDERANKSGYGDVYAGCRTALER